MRAQYQILFSILTLLLLGGVITLTMALISPPTLLRIDNPVKDYSPELSFPAPERDANSHEGCTAFCLDNDDACVFGTNMDNSLEIGLLFINKRHVLKTTWDPNTAREYVRWISRYGSVTVNFVGYQMAWAGMNEAGLMISTMALPETQGPIPDERPPFQGPFWMQYQLDNHNSIDQVISSDAEIRVPESQIDHYLVCDRTGACATIEFLEGKLVHHTGETLPVKALTNSTYRESISTWVQNQSHVNLQNENSLWRFTMVANRNEAFEPSTLDTVITYAFDTLKIVSGDNTVWSYVFDPVNLRVHFRTKNNPRIRYVDFSRLDFSCRIPDMFLDVHADVSGDVRDEFTTYTHAASFAHSTIFFNQYEGFTQPPFLVDTLLWGLESFPCQDVDLSTQTDLARYRSLIPITVRWAGLTILHRVGPFWIPLVVLSLAYVIWRMVVWAPSSSDKRFFWALVTIILGPFGLLAYLLTHRKQRQSMKPPCSITTLDS